MDNDIIDSEVETSVETEVEVAVKKARTKFVVDEAHLSLLIQAIDDNVGSTSSKLAKITGLDSKEVKALLKHLRSAGVVKMEGTKRGARYHRG